ncbi:MAG TPA: hypothetical protein VGO34_01855 [Alphaproteobacteria bacterium]|jgi:hypothetical protein
MTTLNPNDLPYAKAANLLTDAYNLFAGAFRLLRKLNAVVTHAFTMRDRYYELNALTDSRLKTMGLYRNTIAQAVAAEAGFFAAPFANTNEAKKNRAA